MGMAAFSSYEQYKNTDSEWLDEIPIHWEEKRLKHLGSLYSGLGGKSGDDFSKHFVEGLSPFVPFVSIANYERVPSDYQFVKVQASESQNLVKQGDILFLMSSETFEDIAKAALFDQPDQDVFLNSFCKGFRPNVERLNSDFANYLLMAQCYRDYFSSSARGFTRINLKQEYINNTPAILPPLPEQRAIAAFLDNKCAKIDGAVKIKEDQIALLRERRQIIIQDAVTRGLNPAAPMKDSGVDWIGQIPAHWEVRNAKWLFSHRKERARKGEPQLAATQKYGVIPQTDFMDLEGRRVVQVFLDFDILKHVEAGDFVMSMRSFQGGIEYSEYTGCVSSAYVALKPGEKVYARYFKYLLKSTRYIEALQSTSNLVRDGQALRFDNFSMVDLMVVPVDEQRQIADYLDSHGEKTESAIAIKERQIAALKEYKTSLINAAVTGKIKVI